MGRRVSDSFDSRIGGAWPVAHQPDALSQSDHGLPLAVLARRTSCVYERRAGGCDRVREQLDRLRRPPGTGAEDGQRLLYVKELTIAHVLQWGWRFVDEFCWRKTDNGVPGGWGNRFKNAWEPIHHFYRQREIKFRPEAVGHLSDGCFDYSPDTPESNSGSGLLGQHEDRHTGIDRDTLRGRTRAPYRLCRAGMAHPR